MIAANLLATLLSEALQGFHLEITFLDEPAETSCLLQASNFPNFLESKKGATRPLNCGRNEAPPLLLTDAARSPCKIVVSLFSSHGGQFCQNKAHSWIVEKLPKMTDLDDADDLSDPSLPPPILAKKTV